AATGRQALGERLALEELHHQYRNTLRRRKGIENFDHPWMLHTGRRARLPEEARSQGLGQANRGLDELQCDAAVGHLVARLPHFTHPTAPDTTFETVAPSHDRTRLQRAMREVLVLGLRTADAPRDRQRHGDDET